MERLETETAPSASDSESGGLLILPQTHNTAANNPSSNPNSSSAIRAFPETPRWPTIDGPLGLSAEDSVGYARRFFNWGFCMLPLLWALNCFYFWPVLRHSRSFPLIRPYVVKSAVGVGVFATLLSSWALTFAVGGERLFGHVWDDMGLCTHNDELSLPLPVEPGGGAAECLPPYKQF